MPDRWTPCRACTPMTRPGCQVCHGAGQVRRVRFTGLGAPAAGKGPAHLRRRRESGEPERAPGDEGCVTALVVGAAGLLAATLPLIEVLA